MLPGVPNAAIARQVERAGFDAVYVSGAGLANATAGVPDIGLLTLTEVAQLAGYIANAVKIPAIVDADTGFGGAENVARTIHNFEQAGLAGCHIEDQEFPKRCGHLAGKEIVDVDEMIAKIRAALRCGAARVRLSRERTRVRWKISFQSSARGVMSKPAQMVFSRKLCKAQRNSKRSPAKSKRRCLRT